MLRAIFGPNGLESNTVLEVLLVRELADAEMLEVC